MSEREVASIAGKVEFENDIKRGLWEAKMRSSRYSRGFANRERSFFRENERQGRRLRH